MTDTPGDRIPSPAPGAPAAFSPASSWPMPLLLHPRCGAARAAGPVATRIAATVRYSKNGPRRRPILAPTRRQRRRRPSRSARSRSSAASRVHRVTCRTHRQHHLPAGAAPRILGRRAGAGDTPAHERCGAHYPQFVPGSALFSSWPGQASAWICLAKIGYSTIMAEPLEVRR